MLFMNPNIFSLKHMICQLYAYTQRQSSPCQSESLTEAEFWKNKTFLAYNIMMLHGILFRTPWQQTDIKRDTLVSLCFFFFNFKSKNLFQRLHRTVEIMWRRWELCWAQRAAETLRGTWLYNVWLWQVRSEAPGAHTPLVSHVQVEASTVSEGRSPGWEKQLTHTAPPSNWKRKDHLEDALIQRAPSQHREPFTFFALCGDGAPDPPPHPDSVSVRDKPTHTTSIIHTEPQCVSLLKRRCLT